MCFWTSTICQYLAKTSRRSYPYLSVRILAITHRAHDPRYRLTRSAHSDRLFSRHYATFKCFLETYSTVISKLIVKSLLYSFLMHVVHYFLYTYHIEHQYSLQQAFYTLNIVRMNNKCVCNNKAACYEHAAHWTLA